MWDAKIIDKSNQILGLKWSGHVKKEEVAQANEKLEQLIKELNSTSFDVIVEMENLMAFPKDTQQEIVKQQKWIISKGMNRAAVVVDRATTKMQLKRTSQESDNKNESHFSSIDEAIQFLKSK